MANRIFISIIPLLISLFGCGVKGDFRYRDLTDFPLRTGSIDPSREAVTLQILDKSTGAPIEGVRFRIDSAIQPYESVSNSAGEISLPISEEYRTENPRLTHDHSGEVTLQLSSTASFQEDPDSNRKIQYVSVEDKAILRQGDVAVFYSPEVASQATATLEELLRQEQLIENILGIEPVKWAVVLVPEERGEEDHVVSSGRGFSTIFQFSVESLSNSHMTRINTHEWVEATLTQRFHLYESDVRNRFIGDGLADLFSFRAGGLSQHYAKSLEDLLEAETTEINLLRDFQAIHLKRPKIRRDLIDFRKLVRSRTLVAGYPLSFAFWYDLSERFGEDLPKNFLTHLRQTPNRKAKDCIRILTKLTGDRRIEQRLRNANVRDAYETILGIISVQEERRAFLLTPIDDSEDDSP